MSGLQLDMNKSAQALRMNLAKAGVINLPQAEVAFDLDVSGSYDDEHQDGLTNDLMARLVPWGLLLDPDKKLDVFTFSNGREHAHYVGDVNEQTYQDYVRRKIINKVPGYGNGTDYVHVLRLNLQHFGWIEPVGAGAPAQQRRGGMLGGLFGGNKPAAAPSPSAPLAKRRSLILFNTDGDNDSRDKQPTYDLFREMQDNQYGVYVMFIGVSNQGGGFPFLQKLADDFDNCGLTIVRDVKRWVQKSDDEIAGELITDELIKWFKGG